MVCLCEWMTCPAQSKWRALLCSFTVPHNDWRQKGEPCRGFIPPVNAKRHPVSLWGEWPEDSKVCGPNFPFSVTFSWSLWANKGSWKRKTQPKLYAKLMGLKRPVSHTVFPTSSRGYQQSLERKRVNLGSYVQNSDRLRTTKQPPTAHLNVLSTYWTMSVCFHLRRWRVGLSGGWGPNKFNGPFRKN